MNLGNVFKNLPHIHKVNLALKKCKYVHLMYNDKFNKAFVDFLNSNFNQEEHIILCKRWVKDETIAPFPKGINVIEIYSLFGLDFECKNIKKIICHSLFDKEIVNYFYKHPYLLQNKFSWLIWGGDLYEAPRNKINDFVRRNCSEYLLLAEKDYDIVCNKYDKLYSSNTKRIEYPMLIEANAAIRSTNDKIIIQLNNSCDAATLEMLDTLAKFKDRDIKIVTILSYGDLKYKEAIIQKGKTIFQGKFEYLDKYLQPLKYASHLSNIRIYISNQNRQQGIGNIELCLLFGKKIFIKSNISTYKHYIDQGYEIFDTNAIKDMDFETFISQNANNNVDLAKLHTSDAYRKELWENVFDGK